MNHVWLTGCGGLLAQASYSVDEAEVLRQGLREGQTRAQSEARPSAHSSF